FFSLGAGGAWRRRANRDLSSMIHSTDSPFWNSRAWATAEGKLMYHCSLAWRLMSWTLVGKRMGRTSLLSSHLTRYRKTRILGTKNCTNVLMTDGSGTLSSQRPNPRCRHGTLK